MVDSTQSSSFNFDPIKLATNLSFTLPHITGIWIRTDGDFLIQSSDPYSSLYLLKHSANFSYSLKDLWITDCLDLDKRFQVNYRLTNIYTNHSIVLRCYLKQPMLASISSLWPCATWYEREAWDMYGVVFTGNSNLRRLLTDYSFRGHPLRKDFPLNGFVEIRYDDTQKSIVTEPIEVTQEYRNFQFRSPWFKVVN